MEKTTASMYKRLWHIGIFELVMFLLSCGVHYFAYKSRGSLPFSSELDVLFLFSWAGIAIVMTYASYTIKKRPELATRRIMIVALIYGALYLNWAAGTVPMLLNGKIPLVVKAAGPLSWLVLRGWLSWLLIGGAIRLAAPARTEEATAA